MNERSKILAVVEDLTPVQQRLIIGMVQMMDPAIHALVDEAREHYKGLDGLSDATIFSLIGQLLDVMHQPGVVADVKRALKDDEPAPFVPKVLAQKTGVNYDN